jgi:Tol biopolymer transport system component
MRTLILTFVLASVSAVAVAAEPSAMVGSWSTDVPSGKIVSTYDPDGGYSCCILSPGGETKVRRGKYRIDGDSIVVTMDDGKSSRVRWSVSGDVLTLSDEKGNSTRMVRAAAPAFQDAVPPALPREKNSADYYRQAGPDLTKYKSSRTGHILYSRVELLQTPFAPEPLFIPKIFIMTGDGQGQEPFLYPPHFQEASTPCWSPDGTKVVFCSNLEMARSALYGDIFLADLRRGTLARVTGNEWTAGPVNGYGSINGYITDESTEGRRVEQVNISIQGGGGRIFHPSGWTPPGNGLKGRWRFRFDNVPAGDLWIKCWVNKHYADWQVVHVPIRGEVDVVLNLGSGQFIASSPSISPDGRYIVCLWQHPYYDLHAPLQDNAVKGRESPEKGYDTPAVIDVAKGGLPVASWDPLRHQGLLAKDPRLSPDGRWIAMTVGLSPGESVAVCSMESFLAGNPDVRIVAQGQIILGGGGVGYIAPSWSPDSTRLAFCGYKASPHGFNGNLCVMNLRDGRTGQVTNVSANQCVMKSSWSPDGRSIAFQLITGKRPILDLMDMVTLNFVSDIWTIGVDGSDPRQLTTDGRSSDPAWGP